MVEEEIGKLKFDKGLGPDETSGQILKQNKTIRQ